MDYRIPTFLDTTSPVQPRENSITERELKRELTRGDVPPDQIEHELDIIRDHLAYQDKVQYLLQNELHGCQRRMADIERRMEESMRQAADLRAVRKRLYDRRYFHRKEKEKHGRKHPLAGVETEGAEKGQTGPGADQEKG